MRLPPGLYKDKYYFYYQVVNTEYSWYMLNPLFPERGWSYECGCVAYASLEPSSPLEFVLLTGTGFDPTRLEEAYARRVAQRATRRRSRKDDL